MVFSSIAIRMRVTVLHSHSVNVLHYWTRVCPAAVQSHRGIVDDINAIPKCGDYDKTLLQDQECSCLQ